MLAHRSPRSASDRGITHGSVAGFITKRARSAGVSREYTGTTGTIHNWQIGVFCADATDAGRVLIDRKRDLPGPGPTTGSTPARPALTTRLASAPSPT